MIIEKQINEIKNHLDASENPFFIMDGDTDGLCSFLLLRRYIGRGEYFMLRDNPEVTIEMLDKIEKIKPDKIFVLDKPLMSQEFIDNINIPIIWIDHHMPVKRDGVKYYNPRIENIHDERSTSYWAYEIVKEDLWLAEMGIIADWGLQYIDEFSKKYPGLIQKKIKIAPDVLYNTKFGNLIKLVQFLLKGKLKDVNRNINMMIKIKNIDELLEEKSEHAKKLMKYANKMGRIYDELLENALKNKSKDKLFLFMYHKNEASFTGELSNELTYKLPDKFIIIAREKDDRIIMSMRSSNHFLPALLDKALNGLDGRGGGHDHACGASVAKEDFDEFINRVKKLI